MVERLERSIALYKLGEAALWLAIVILLGFASYYLSISDEANAELSGGSIAWTNRALWRLIWTIGLLGLVMLIRGQRARLTAELDEVRSAGFGRES